LKYQSGRIGVSTEYQITIIMKILQHSAHTAFAVALLAAPSAICTAQRVQVSSIWLQTGYSGNPAGIQDLATLKTILPNEPWLQQSFPGGAPSSQLYGFANPGSKVAISIRNARPKNDFQKYGQLRLGISTNRGQDFGWNYNKQTNFKVDTLASTATNQQYFIDSIVTTNDGITNWYQDIGMQVAAMFSTNTKGRWSLYAGFAMAFGGSLYNKYAVSSSSAYYITAPYMGANSNNSNWGYGGRSSYNYTSQTKDMPSRRTMSVATPIGVQFRIGKRRDIAKHLRMNYEFSPSVTSISIAGVANAGRAVSADHMLGLVYAF
jgi:hypothetical protein